MTIHLIGASGRSGRAVLIEMRRFGLPVVLVARRPWIGPEPARIANLTDAPALREALQGAAVVVSCAHARHTAAILAVAPASARLVLMGSTRKFTRWPDDHARGVLDGEAALRASGRNGVMLHPTMIYGAQGEDNVRRLAALLRRLTVGRLPVVPLPGGGHALVQPVFQNDVTRALIAAIGRDWSGPHSLVVCGPTPLPYADFVRAVAHAAGLRMPRIVPVPAWPLRLAAPLTRVPFVPRIRADEIRRLTEDKAFDPGPMRRLLGVEPVPLADGLARTFATPQG